MSADEFTTPRRIGLALSGGGIRAAVFHLGVLKHLAEEGRLEHVTQLSTVSGGSLVTGAIFARAEGRWPSSSEFIESVYPSIRRMLISGDLLSFRALGLGGAIRANVQILFRRANILADMLRRRWGIELELADLPPSPVWHINTTCIETGKNWRFSREAMGDWKFGRHFSPRVSVAEAIAASAAVPYAIGALKLSLPEHGWWQTDPATKAPKTQITPAARTVHLWDGGAYENMALEPLYKPVEGLQDCDILMCSDASGPLGPPSSIAANLIRGRLASPRLFDIAADQIRSLRSRMLMKSIQQKEFEGYLLRMGTSARSFRLPSDVLPEFLSDEDSLASLNYPTNLMRISEIDFDRIVRHGHETARLTLMAFARNRSQSDTSEQTASGQAIPSVQ
ncbi:patatin-like phospholipase family protein [Aureimonas ureilytica]|uniref:patatin-like phospholipase family protein n=1 Tax=Aureimonas ureilytica TaxID=401562 RepID=UPI00037A3000|nr:patatin-like phospholipase family protein [Aureimonas ureilytica]